MLDLKFVRENVERVKKGLEDRGSRDALKALDELLQHDEQRRNLLPIAEELRRRRNEASKEMAILKKDGKDSQELVEEIRDIRTRIQETEEKLNYHDEKIKEMILTIPKYTSFQRSSGRGP